MKGYKRGIENELRKSWELVDIKEIMKKRYVLKNSALEIFFLDGSSVLFNFAGGELDQEELSSRLIRLRKTRCKNLKYHKTLDKRKIINKTKTQAKWVNYELSTLEYLLYLNIVSGRSFWDIT